MEGGSLNPPFGLQKDLKLCILSALPSKTVLHYSLNAIGVTIVQMSLVAVNASLFIEISAECAHKPVVYAAAMKGCRIRQGTAKCLSTTMHFQKVGMTQACSVAP